MNTVWAETNYLARESREPLKLTLKESTVLVVDLFAAGGRYKPGAVDVTWEFTFPDGRLQVAETTQAFDVDPITLARTPNGGASTTLSWEAD